MRFLLTLKSVQPKQLIVTKTIMPKINIIKNFHYAIPDKHPTLDLGKVINAAYDKDMVELERAATLLNAERHTVSIRFWGDTKSGLKWSIDCDDEPMANRIRGFFTKWKMEQDKLNEI